MGFSLKKIGKTISNVVKNPGDALEKVAKTAAAGAVGFATGGGVGAVGAAVREGVRQSKTGEGAAFTFRSGYQAGATGLITAGAAAIAAKAAGAVAAKGGIGAVAKGAMSKAVAFGKAGGLGKTLLAGAKQIIPFAKGLIPSKAPGETTGETEARIDAATEANPYAKSILSDLSKSGREAAASVRESAMGRLKGSIQDTASRLTGRVRSQAAAIASPPVNVSVESPTLAGMGGLGNIPWAPIIFIGGALLLSRGKIK